MWLVALSVVAVAAWWPGAPGRGASPVDQVARVAEPVSRAASSAVSEAGSESSSIVRFDAVASRPGSTWDLPKTHNDRVQRWIDYLTGPNRDRMRVWLEREGRYGGLIRERLRERGMPEDLLYLGMIESGLSPKAYSHAHASGLWQFISATGQRYGLEVSTWVDERRDPVKATDAALDYLSDLHDRFGSWYLAAAAYNSGENRVERILRQRVNGRKGSEALFWLIDDYLPRETRDYVPLMLAAAHIGKNPGKYGFHEVALEPPLSYEPVEVPGGVPLSALAEAAGVERAAVEALNPHLMRGITPPGRAWEVRLPVGSGEAVVAAMARLEEEWPRTVIHRVARGETLTHIARRYGVGLDVVRSSNRGVNPTRLQVGQQLQIPLVADGV
jgi:membrane-bound lytic murein transglycosylase D